MSGSGRETLPDVSEWWEALLDVREWLGGPPGHLVVVNWPSWMSWSGWKALPDVHEWSGVPPGCLVVVGSPSRMSRSGREALVDVWEWSGDPPGYQGIV